MVKLPLKGGEHMKYRNRVRISRLANSLTNWIKSNIIIYIKRDVPAYITNDVAKRLIKGEREIVLHMCKGESNNKGIVDYLNEYHNKKNYWSLEFLHIAFKVTEERIRMKLSKYSDIDIETLDISDTDKRIVIKFLDKKENDNDRN